MPIHQNATLLKGQHPPSPAEMAEIVNLPCHEDISTPMHMPMGTSPKIPYAITMSIGFHPYTNSNQCAIQRRVHINADGSRKFTIGESAPAYQSLYGENEGRTVTLSREHSPTHTLPEVVRRIFDHNNPRIS